jgi:hypothetical protein
MGTESFWGWSWPHAVASLIACNAGGCDVCFAVGAALATSFKVLCSAQKRLRSRLAYSEPICKRGKIRGKEHWKAAVAAATVLALIGARTKNSNPIGHTTSGGGW